MVVATVLRDTRERRPWNFGEFRVAVEDATLATGDYAILACCRHDSGRDTYHPRFAVERKTGSDFLASITADRDRFEAEIRRASAWPRPLCVVVEEPWETFAENRGIMARREIYPGQVAGTVSTWIDCYNVEFHFAGSRRLAKRYALCRLLSGLADARKKV
jgi:ERCC4-type nuclease